MANTPKHVMPEIAVSQSNKYVTHNEALRHLDGKVFLLIEDKDLVTAPSHNDGDLWIVAGLGGGWSGFAVNDVAHSYDGAWYNYTPQKGWIAYVDDESLFYYFTGTVWVQFSGGKFLSALNDMTKLGLSDPGLTKVKDDGGGSTGVYLYAFDDSTEEELGFSINLDDSYPNGADIAITVYMLPPTSAGGDVKWGLEYSWAKLNSVALFGTGTKRVVHTIGVSDTNEIQDAEFPHISGSEGTGILRNANIVCRIFRDATDSGDDYVGDVCLVGVKIEFV